MAVSKFTSASNANDFNITIGSTYSAVTLTQEYPSGGYTFTSANLNNSMDCYFYNSDGTLVAYTGGKSISPTRGFSKVVILNASPGDVLSFSYKFSYTTVAETTEVTAGPVILSTSPTSLPNINSSTTVTGLNFATDIAATFTGTDNLVRNAKSVVRGSANSLVVTRPDTLPVSANPYYLTVTNPSVAYQPTQSNSNRIQVNAGVAPVWQTSANLGTVYYGAPNSIQLTATDADGGSSVTYAITTSALPTGLSLNTSTGLITGTWTGTPSAYTFTVRATDSGGNYSDLLFSLSTAYAVVTGGTLTSDATYYYRAFTGNGTLAVSGTINAEVLLVAGGGGGGYDVGSGGGAGGLVLKSGYTIPNGSYAVAIGSGGPGSTDGATSGATRSGQNSTLGSLLTALGGGGSGSYNANPAASGGSGGGGLGAQNVASQAGGAGLQPSSQWGGYGNPGGTGVGSNGTNNYSGAAGGGGAGGAGKDGTTSWTTAGDTVYGAGGVGLQVSWITSSYGDPNFIGWFAGGGGASTDTPTNGPYYGWGYGGKGGGGDGTNRVVLNGSQNGYYYIDGKPNTGGGGGGGGSIAGTGYPASGGNNGGPGGSGICVIRYTKASVGG
jgi:hypothetical protein